MKLSELRRYRRRVRQLGAVEQQLREYAVTDSVQGSKGAPSFEKTTRLVEGYPHTERVMQLLEQRHIIRRWLQSADDYIFSVEDERICTALLLYCCDERFYEKTATQILGHKPTGKDPMVRIKWAHVAQEMQESSGDALRMAVYRYMLDD